MQNYCISIKRSLDVVFNFVDRTFSSTTAELAYFQPCLIVYHRYNFVLKLKWLQFIQHQLYFTYTERKEINYKQRGDVKLKNYHNYKECDQEKRLQGTPM